MTILSLLVALLLPGLAVALWPIPRVLSSGNFTVKLNADFAIHVDIPKAPNDLYAAVSRASSHLKTDRFERLVVGRSAVDAPLLADAAELTSLILSITEGRPVRSIAAETTQAIDDKIESYTLTIPEHGGQAALEANSTLGLFRGLATFEQLWYDCSGTKYTLEAPIEIADTPAFVSWSCLP